MFQFVSSASFEIAMLRNTIAEGFSWYSQIKNPLVQRPLIRLFDVIVIAAEDGGLYSRKYAP